MRKIAKLVFITIFLFSILDAEIYSNYNADTVVVSGSRISSKKSKTPRKVNIITRNNIDRMKVSSVDELLKQSTALDLQSRGNRGVQTDVRIRGAGSNQSLILIDGMKVNDPQTGHHNLNIPIPTNEIEKIEVLKGGAGRLYGPNALGGTINVITKDNNERKADVQFVRGQNNYIKKMASAVLPIGKFTSRISYSNKISDGYRHNTDFDISTFFYKSHVETDLGNFSLLGGYNDKEFGANNFYTPPPADYPDSYEETEATFISFHHKKKMNWGRISSKIGWRKHKDRYLLKRDNPDFYENKHKTYLYTGKTQATIDMNYLLLDIGTEYGTERINSSSLGEHERTRFGLFAEARRNLGKFTITPGISSFYYSDWSWQFLPGIDMTYRFNKNISLFSSVEKSFRTPTFTELYYKSPANMGNENLNPEKAWSYELGARYNYGIINTELSFFSRDNREMIDYLYDTQDSVWKAENVNNLNMRGVDFSLSINEPTINNSDLIKNIGLSYSYIKGSKSSDYRSKYVFDHLNHNLNLNIAHKLLSQLSVFWNIEYKNRTNSGDFAILNGNFEYKYKFIKINVGVNNIFDKQYKSFGYLPMPGRWAEAGVTLSL